MISAEEALSLCNLPEVNDAPSTLTFMGVGARAVKVPRSRRKPTRFKKKHILGHSCYENAKDGRGLTLLLASAFLGSPSRTWKFSCSFPHLPLTVSPINCLQPPRLY